MKYFRTIVLAGLVVFASMNMTGCGGGTEIKATNTTMGQELTDLQEAYEKEIRTEKEYKKAKKKILNKY